MTASEEKVTYEGRCHCGAITFNIKTPQLEPPGSHAVVECSCSICHKNGYLLVYPLKENLEITQGKDHLKEYRCISGKAPHYFCPTCASSLYIAPPAGMHPAGDVYCVNVRMLRGVDLKQLTITELNGKSETQAEYNDKYW